MPSSNDFQFKRSVQGIVERIAYQLGDAEPGDEYSGFDENWIKAKVYDILKWLQSRRPNLFGHEVSFDLKGGDSQKLPEDCDELLNVISVTISGKQYPVTEGDFSALQAARVYSKLLTTCDPCNFTYAVSPNDSRQFLISPPVAPSGSSVTATCSALGRYFDDPELEIDCEAAKWINTVVEYVLFQAFSMDGDNPVSTSLAETHRSTFFELAPVQRRAES